MKPYKEDHARVLIQAEYIFLIAILLGFLLNFFWPLKFLPKVIHIPLGIIVISAGLALLYLSMDLYKKARTYSLPHRPAKTLITKGPYKYYAHPMYLARILQQIGIGLAFGNIWILITLIPALIVLWYAVIVPEEQYMERRFGLKYTQYKFSTQNWFKKK